jgi:peptide/nickel transport system permease protein
VHGGRRASTVATTLLSEGEHHAALNPAVPLLLPKVCESLRSSPDALARLVMALDARRAEGAALSRPSFDALCAVLLAALLGVLIGAAAALAGGWLDDVLMRVNDVLLALPSLLVLMLMASFVGRQPVVLTLTLAVMYAPPIARLVRGAALGVLGRDFVVAARLRGAGSGEIVVREVLPNIRGVVITEVAMQFSWILLAFSSLSFLGLGTTPPTPEWGLMVAGARTYITINALPLVAPMVMMASLVLAVNSLIDRSALGEPS